MIKDILVFCFGIQFFFSYGQDNAATKNLLIGRWKMHGVENEKGTDYLGNITNETYDFKSNSVFFHETEYLDSIKVTIQGKYKIKKKGRKLKLRNKKLKIFPPNRYVSWNKKSIKIINKINEKELIFVYGDNSGVYFKRIE